MKKTTHKCPLGNDEKTESCKNKNCIYNVKGKCSIITRREIKF